MPGLLACLSETRIGLFDFSEPTCTGLDALVTHGAHRASIVSSPQLTTDLDLYTQADPLGIQPDLNVFRYAASNPVRFTDPTGQQAAEIAVGAASVCVAILETMPPVLVGTIVVGAIIVAGKECAQAQRCGNCTPEEHAALQAAVNGACKAGPRRCSPSQDPVTLATNMGKNLACAAARDTINQRCFGGGDAGHRQAADQARAAAIRCARLLRGLGAGGPE